MMGTIRACVDGMAHLRERSSRHRPEKKKDAASERLRELAPKIKKNFLNRKRTQAQNDLTVRKKNFGEFPGGPEVKAPWTPLEVGTDSILIRNPRSHMQRGRVKK